MNHNKLQNQWGIWYIYQADTKTQSKPDNKEYGDNTQLIYQLETTYDLAYLWKNSPIALLSNYFGRQGGKQFTYQVKDKQRKVNSIEFFKKGIEPRWQDKKNENGGRLVFQVPKSDKSNAIYQGLVFYLMGEGFDMSERLNGFRFISSKSPSSVSFRAQIWFDFSHDDTDTLVKFKDIFEKMFNEVGYQHSQKTIKYINMKGEDKKEGKGKQEKKELPQGGK